MLDKLTEQEQKEYEKLQGLERFGKLTGKVLPESSRIKLEDYRRRLGESISSDEEVDKEGTGEKASDSFGDIFGIPRELVEYRKRWGMEVDCIDAESKEKIVKAAGNIKVDVEKYSDGSRLIEFKLRDKMYKILDVKLDNYTDDKYRGQTGNQVELGGMKGDNVDMWKNEKLKEYVKEKKREGLFMPEKRYVKTLLRELGNLAHVFDETAQIAMLMYLTGMEGDYWLDMEDEDSRFKLRCCADARYFHDGDFDSEEASLFMMHATY